MDDKKLNQQLMKFALIIVISSLLFLGIGMGIVSFVLNVSREADIFQMQMEAQEYKERISHQIDKNFQILTLLSKTYEVSGITESDEDIKQTVLKTDTENDFVSLFYFSKDGSGLINTPGRGSKNDLILDECNEFLKEAVLKSFQGENAISLVFESKIYEGKVFVYSVPVYFNGEIVGALAASDTVKIFSDIADGDLAMGGNGYVHIINSEGTFLIRSPKTLVKEPMDTIFSGPYLSDDMKIKTKEALSKGENSFGDFKYKGQECIFYIEPIEVNNLYLFCVNISGDLSLIHIWPKIGIVYLRDFVPLLPHGRFDKNVNLIVHEKGFYYIRPSFHRYNSAFKKNQVHNKQ